MHGSGGLLFVACLAALVPGSFVGAVNVDACDAGSGTCVDAALPGVVSDAAATADGDDDGSLAQLRVVQPACMKLKEKCGKNFVVCCPPNVCNNVKLPGTGQCGPAGR